MPDTTITAADLVERHAENIAFVTGLQPAVDVDGFITQLVVAADRFTETAVVGHHDVRSAARLLDQARDDEGVRDELLKCASLCLLAVPDMTDEYRRTAGG
jgi:hypothetical protein